MQNQRGCTGGCLRLLIASTAAANGLPLYTRNASDFDALKRIIKVIGI